MVGCVKHPGKMRELFCKKCNEKDPFCPECYCKHMKAKHKGKVSYLADEILERLEQGKYTEEQEKVYKEKLGKFREKFYTVRAKCELRCVANIEADKKLNEQLSERKSHASLQEQNIKAKIFGVGNEIEKYHAQVGEWKKDVENDIRVLVKERKLDEAWKNLTTLSDLPNEETSSKTITEALETVEGTYSKFEEASKPLMSDLVEIETLEAMKDDLKKREDKIDQFTKEIGGLNNQIIDKDNTIGIFPL